MSSPTGFIESPRFPDAIARGSTGTPMYRTSVIEVDSGYEYRNVHWSAPKHSFDVTTGIKRIEHLELLRSWFHVAHGKAFGFRFKDWQDYKSCPMADTPSATDQLIGVGDGTTRTFKLLKRYIVGSYELVRPITKPVQGTVLLMVDGVDMTSALTSDWRIQLDEKKGEISWSTGSGSWDPPAVGVQISAGYEYDVPVRFGSDELETSYEAYRAGAASMTVVEDRIPD